MPGSAQEITGQGTGWYNSLDIEVFSERLASILEVFFNLNVAMILFHEWKIEVIAQINQKRTGDGIKSTGQKGKVWLSYEIKGKKQSLKLCQNTKKKEMKGMYLDIDQDSILADVLYEIGCKWEKEQSLKIPYV